MLAIERAGYRPGDDVYLGLDVAASEFYRDGRYRLSTDGEAERSSSDMVDWCRRLVDAYPILSVEDGLAENDWEGWLALTAALGTRVQLVGDDLFVTNMKIFERGIRESVSNRDTDQAEPDRHADRDPGRDRDGEAGLLRGRHLPPVRARPRTRPSPTWPSRPTRGRSRRGRSAGPIEPPNTTSCCVSSVRSEPERSTPARRCSTICQLCPARGAVEALERRPAGAKP